MKPHWDIETLISVDDIIFDPTTAIEFQNDIGRAWRIIFDFRHVKKKNNGRPLSSPKMYFNHHVLLHQS